MSQIPKGGVLQKGYYCIIQTGGGGGGGGGDIPLISIKKSGPASFGLVVTRSKKVSQKHSITVIYQVTKDNINT